MSTIPPCSHDLITVAPAGYRCQGSDQWLVSLTVSCKTCGQPFESTGLPVGVSTGGLSLTGDGQKLIVPVRPFDLGRFRRRIGREALQC